MKYLAEKGRRRFIRVAALHLKKKKNRTASIEEKAKIANERKRNNSKKYIDAGFNPPKNLERTPIFLPKTLSLWENYDEAASIISKIRTMGLKNRELIIIIFDNLKKIDPATALVLVSEMYRIKNLTRSRHGQLLDGTWPNDQNVHRLLSDLGFYKLINIPDRIEPDIENPRTVYTGFKTNNRVVTEDVDRYVKAADEYVVKLDEIARSRLIGSIVEAMQNTLDHAYSEPNEYDTMNKRWFFTMGFDIALHEIRILIYDQGVGVPNTIKLETFESLRIIAGNILTGIGYRESDGGMIKVATHKYKSRTMQPGRGRGFDNMKKFVDMSEDGELRVLSNKGRYTYINEEELYSDSNVSIEGTLIELRFRSEELKMEEEK